MTKRLVAGLVLAMIAAVSAGNAAADDAFDVSKIGPQVGDTVPDFTLPDQDGAEHSLNSLMGPKGLVLVFFRSADW